MIATDGAAHIRMLGDAGAPLSQAYPLAHPHADRELVYRAQGNRDLGKVGLGLALDGAHVLGTAMGVPGTDFLEGEASLRIGFRTSVWKPFARFPLSPDRRMDCSFGLAAERAW